MCKQTSAIHNSDHITEAGRCRAVRGHKSDREVARPAKWQLEARGDRRRLFQDRILHPSLILPTQGTEV
jgi:hypothetical protein